MRVRGKTADTESADTVADTESAFSKAGDTRAAGLDARPHVVNLESFSN